MKFKENWDIIISIFGLAILLLFFIKVFYERNTIGLIALIIVAFLLSIPLFLMLFIRLFFTKKNIFRIILTIFFLIIIIITLVGGASSIFGFGNTF